MVYCSVGSADVENNITTEAQRQVPFRTAGVIEKLYFRTPAVAAGTQFTIRIRINGGNGNLAITTPAGTTGDFVDDDAVDSVSVGDLVNYSMVIGSGDGWPIAIGCVFNSNPGTVTRLSSSTGGSVSKGTNGTEYLPLSGVPSTRSDENDVKARTALNGTWKGLFVYVTANSRNSTTTFRARKNAGNGNQAVSVGASATGRFQDTSNTDTLVQNDEIDYSITTATGSGTITFNHFGSEIVTSDGTYQNSAANSGISSLNYNSTEYQKLGGHLTWFSTWHYTYNLLPGMVTNPTVVVRSNTIDAGISTFEVYRPSYEQSYIAIQVPAGSTGTFENVGEALFHDKDLERLIFRMKTSRTATTGSIGFSYLGTKHWPFEMRASADGQIQPASSVPRGEVTYTVEDTTFNMATLTGAATSLSLGDEDVSGWITLPFTFNFFGTRKYGLRVAANGYVRFSDFLSGSVGNSTWNGNFGGPGGSSSWLGDCIAPFASDLDPGSGGTIKYETLGSEPNRIFVIEWSGVPFYDSADTVTFQLKLFEADSHIEIHVQDGSNDPLYWQCQGLQSSAMPAFFKERTFVGSGYRFEETITNEAVSFTPVDNT